MHTDEPDAAMTLFAETSGYQDIPLSKVVGPAFVQWMLSSVLHLRLPTRSSFGRS
jgi:hypothetical protein